MTMVVGKDFCRKTGQQIRKSRGFVVCAVICTTQFHRLQAFKSKLQNLLMQTTVGAAPAAATPRPASLFLQSSNWFSGQTSVLFMISPILSLHSALRWNEEQGAGGRNARVPETVGLGPA